MPRGCMVELAAALCDPQLCRAERRLWPGGRAGRAGPVAEAARALLVLGEATNAQSYAKNRCGGRALPHGACVPSRRCAVTSKGAAAVARAAGHA